MRILIGYLELSALSFFSAFFISIFLWSVILLVTIGWNKTWKTIKELGPFYESGKLSTDWLIKTGALPGAVIGLIAGPLLGPIFGAYVFALLRGVGSDLYYIDFNGFGALLIGVFSGIIGYFFRIK
jgi:hypothetical protein